MARTTRWATSGLIALQKRGEESLRAEPIAALPPLFGQLSGKQCACPRRSDASPSSQTALLASIGNSRRRGVVRLDDVD